jgi:hypothetical protein
VGRIPFSDIVSRINLLSPIKESPCPSQFSRGKEEEEEEEEEGAKTWRRKKMLHSGIG